jgi:hypothetical protein
MRSSLSCRSANCRASERGIWGNRMPMKKPRPKRVAYLWGAGATHAEAQLLGSKVSLLMRDSPRYGEGITTRILRRTGAVSSFGAEGDGSVDIEKLISLLAASGKQSHADLAERLRENYFVELKASLFDAKVLNNPGLAIRLFEMHANPNFQRDVEILAGVITTNHDGLLQLASQRVFGAVNPGFRFASKDFDATEWAPQILQLHGSFTWQFGIPTKITKFSRQSSYEDTVWIPRISLAFLANMPNRLGLISCGSRNKRKAYFRYLTRFGHALEMKPKS